MPITASINNRAGLRVHRHTGAVTAAAFHSLIEFYRANPQLSETDLISIIDEDADFSAIALADLPLLRAAFRALHLEHAPTMILRSVWVCPNIYAWRLLEEWLRDRHSRDGMHTEVALVARLEDANCLFDEHELAAVRAWRGFEELQRFGGDA